MKNIFSRGDFAVYRKTSLNDAMEDIVLSGKLNDASFSRLFRADLGCL